MVFCGLICWYSVSWFRSSKKKLLTTNYTLSTLPKTIISFILKMELFSSQFSIFVWKKSVPCWWSVSHSTHMIPFSYSHKSACQKKPVACIQCVYLRDQTAKKEMKMFAFSTWRDHLVVNFSHWLKNGIRGIIYQGEIALNIKAYSTFFYPLFRCVWEFFFRKIQRQAFYSRFEALKLKNKINLSEYIHRHTNCIWSLSIHLLSI